MISLLFCCDRDEWVNCDFDTLRVVRGRISKFFGLVVQWIERGRPKSDVGGSIPSEAANSYPFNI